MSDEQINLIKQVFVELDRFEDLVVDRQRLVEKLRVHPHINKLLNMNALYLPSINKTLTLDRVFSQILSDGEGGSKNKNEIAHQEANLISW